VLLLVGGTLAVVFVPFPWWIPILIVLAGIEVFEARLWLWAVRQRPRAGTQGIVGEEGTLTEAGRVRIRGTSYRARVLEGGPGDRVRVEGVEGMVLVVRRLLPD
jgi:membrane protein implicated in regulation of membrane protease activity